MYNLFAIIVLGLTANSVFGQDYKKYPINVPPRFMGSYNQHAGHNENKLSRQVQLPGLNQATEKQTTTPATTTLESSVTSLSAEVRRCITSCPVTSEYNPVCGTNDVTYDNPGKLICAQKCGVNVTLRRKSRCSPLPTA